MKKRTTPILLIALLLLLMPAALKAQSTTTVEIGYYNENSNTTLLPVNTSNNYSLTQQIYTANEIGMYDGGTIVELEFIDISYYDFNMNGVKVYMKNVSKDRFESNTDMVPVTEDDKVWEGTFTESGTITLTTPFHYDGTSNLLICFYDPTAGSPGSVHKFMSTSTASSHPGNNLALAYYSNSVVPNLNNLSTYSGTKTLLNYRANISMRIIEDIYSIHVDGFSEPTWGGHPDYTWSTPATANYHINTSASYWQDTTLNITLSEQDVFDQEDHEYVLTYHFTCDPGCRFSNTVYVHLNGFDYDYISEVGVDSLGVYARTPSFMVDSGDVVNNGPYINIRVPFSGEFGYYYQKAEFVFPDDKIVPLLHNREITDICTSSEHSTTLQMEVCALTEENGTRFIDAGRHYDDTAAFFSHLVYECL